MRKDNDMVADDSGYTACKRGEVLFFAYGDSTNIRTWSNVPYLCAQGLERAGYSLVRYDLRDGLKRRPFLYLLDRAVYYFVRVGGRLFGFDTSWDFSRTRAFGRATKAFMDEAAASHLDAMAQVVLWFDRFADGLPSLMLSDWTYEYLIEQHERRPLRRYEYDYVARQNAALSSADSVVALFPYSARQIERSTGRSVYCFGCPANTLMEWGEFNSRFSDASTKRSNIIFIGGRHYLTGLKSLVEALEILGSSCSHIKVDVIGMERSDLGLFAQSHDLTQFSFHGYLDKNDPSDRDSFYGLLSNAAVLVNTTAKWVGASSIMEALYYGVPVIATCNEDVAALLSDQTGYVMWCEPEDAAALAYRLESYFRLGRDERRKLASEAHEFAKGHSWDAMARSLGEVIDEISK